MASAPEPAAGVAGANDQALKHVFVIELCQDKACPGGLVHAACKRFVVAKAIRA